MKFAYLFAAVSLAAAFHSYAQTPSAPDHSAHQAISSNTATAATPQSEGEVRKIDLEQGKITLRHGPLTNLDMPP